MIVNANNTSRRLRGVLAPVLTPFTEALEPDVDQFIAHCRYLVESQAGLAIFGTNSEAASCSVSERIHLMDALLEAGLPAHRMMPGTGACALTDAVSMSRHAVRSGAAGVLMLPPFFFKNVAEDGLFAYYSEVIERVGDDRLAIYLYHIPQFTQVPITLALIERLLKRYPGIVAGAKDSSGDWSNTQAMLNAFAADGFDVFPASESLLSKALPLGAAGCISATVNMNPAGIQRLYTGWQDAEGAALQRNADTVRQIFQAMPMIPAMKHVKALLTGHAAWRYVRPPLVSLSVETANKLEDQLRAAGFLRQGELVTA